jgi:hypothetical protein
MTTIGWLPPSKSEAVLISQEGSPFDVIRLGKHSSVMTDALNGGTRRVRGLIQRKQVYNNSFNPINYAS